MVKSELTRLGFIWRVSLWAICPRLIFPVIGPTCLAAVSKLLIGTHISESLSHLIISIFSIYILCWWSLLVFKVLWLTLPCQQGGSLIMWTLSQNITCLPQALLFTCIKSNMFLPAWLGFFLLYPFTSLNLWVILLDLNFYLFSFSTLRWLWPFSLHVTINKSRWVFGLSDPLIIDNSTIFIINFLLVALKYSSTLQSV